MKLKNVYHSENILTLNILEEKLSIYYKNFQDGIKNIIEILRKEFTDIINYETYLKELIECKKIFEIYIGKTFKNDFEKIIKNNFISLSENIKLSIIYDLIIKNIIPSLIKLFWVSKFRKN